MLKDTAKVESGLKKLEAAARKKKPELPGHQVERGEACGRNVPYDDDCLCQKIEEGPQEAVGRRS